MNRPANIPPPLKHGDTVGITSISGTVNTEKLYEGISVIEQMGFRVKLSENIFNTHGYHAGTDEERASGLNDFLADPDVRAVFFARGGYGAYRIIDCVDYNSLKADPVILLGYSDLTFLFSAVLSEISLACFYGPVVQEMGYLSEQCHRNIEQLLSGKKQEALKFERTPACHGKVITGISSGGCLALLSALVGTRYEQDFSESVFFWEDTDEPNYRVDRYLTHLKRAGNIDIVSAMVVGQFSAERRSGEILSVDNILHEITAGAPIPVARNAEFGHAGFSSVIPLGVKTDVDFVSGEINFEF